jgi:hypothetical protein
MSTRSFTRFPFQAWQYWSPTAGGGRMPSGSIEITVRFPGKAIPKEFKNPQPAVVLRKASDNSLVESSYLDYTFMATQPCWDDPGGCPQTAAMSTVAFGSYIVSFELHDDEFRRTKGARGRSKVIGYYTGARAESPFKTMGADRKGAATVMIDADNNAPQLNLQQS